MSGPVWSRRLFVIGAWVLIACGAMHMVGYALSMKGTPENETEKQLLGLMNSYKLPGIGRSMQELMNGFSLTFAVLSATIGAICLVVRSADHALRQRVAMTVALAMIVESGISVLLVRGTDDISHCRSAGVQWFDSHKLQNEANPEWCYLPTAEFPIVRTTAPSPPESE